MYSVPRVMKRIPSQIAFGRGMYYYRLLEVLRSGQSYKSPVSIRALFHMVPNLIFSQSSDHHSSRPLNSKTKLTTYYSNLAGLYEYF